MTLRLSKSTAAAVAVLLAANVYMALRLFGSEYTSEMSSIEGGHIGIVRFAMQHFPDLSWFPIWYGGVPYQNAYPPLLHLTAAGVGWALGLTPGLAYHATSAFFYCLGPLTLFALAYRLSGSRAYSFAAALLYSTISPMLFLSAQVRGDAGGWLGARRFQTVCIYGEGPHVTSLTFLPLAILFLHAWLEDRKPWRLVVCSLSLAAVALTNWIGAFALAMAILCYLLAGIAGPLRKTWIPTAAAGIYAYAIAMSWLPPSTVLTIKRNSTTGVYTFGAMHLVYAAILAAGAGALLWAFRRYGTAPVLRFSLLYLWLTFTISMVGQWYQKNIVPQGTRYHLVMEMVICLTVAFGLRQVLERWPAPYRRLLAIALLFGALFQVRHYRHYIHYMAAPFDVHPTVEYREAEWLARNLPGRRVHLPGSVSFWLNAFTDEPQLEGGFDQGAINFWTPHVNFQILAGASAEPAILWCKAFGVHAVGTTGPNGREQWKPILHPWKYEGVLPVLWREGEDVIYAVPQRTTSLAHVIRPQDEVTERPASADSLDSLKPFVAALDDPALPPADFRWRGMGAATVTADMQPGQLLSVQINYHPGWHASVNGEPRPIHGDKIGLIVVDPRCSGACEVKLNYDGGGEMLASRIVSWLALLIGAVLLFRGQSTKPLNSGG